MNKLLKWREILDSFVRRERMHEATVISHIGNGFCMTPIDMQPSALSYGWKCEHAPDMKAIHNPMAADEDYFIPIRKPATPPLLYPTTEEAEYMRQNLFAALAVPESYLGLGVNDLGDYPPIGNKAQILSAFSKIARHIVNDEMPPSDHLDTVVEKLPNGRYRRTLVEGPKPSPYYQPPVPVFEGVLEQMRQEYWKKHAK